MNPFGFQVLSPYTYKKNCIVMKLYKFRRRIKYGEEKRLLIHLEVYSGFIDLLYNEGKPFIYRENLT